MPHAVDMLRVHRTVKSDGQLFSSKFEVMLAYQISRDTENRENAIR